MEKRGLCQMRYGECIKDVGRVYCTQFAVSAPKVERKGKKILKARKPSG